MSNANPGRGIERRRSPRWPVRKHGTIVFRRQDLPCSLVDESDTGARLADVRAGSCPDEFGLRVGESAPRVCRVVWRSPAALGVSYLEDERVRRLRHGVAHFERLLIADPGPEMARIYRAEIAAAKEMIAQLEAPGNSPPN